MQRTSGGVLHVRFFTRQRLVQDKDICEKQEIKPEATEFLMVTYTLPFSHHPPSLPHAENTQSSLLPYSHKKWQLQHTCPTLPSTAPLCHSLSFSNPVNLQISHKSAHLTNSQKSGQMQDQSKSYTRAICILRKIQPETLPGTHPIKSDLLLLNNSMCKEKFVLCCIYLSHAQK